jgi:hypothetical protein
VAAVRGAFLPQPVDGGAHEQSERSGATLKAIHAQEDGAAARQKAEQVAAQLKEMKLAGSTGSPRIRSTPARRHLCVPKRALAVSANEQPARTFAV